MAEAKDRDDRRTVTIRLGKAEVVAYEEAIKELGLRLPQLAGLGLKLLLLFFKIKKQGGTLRVLRSDGSEETITILELEGVLPS